MSKEPESIQKAFDAHTSQDSEKKATAITLYQQALLEYPKDKRLYLNLGALLRSQGEPEKAAQILQNGIIQLKKESPALLNNLGNSLRDLSRYGEAASMYIRALTQNANYIDADASLYACYQDMELFSLAKIHLSMMKYKYKDKPRDIRMMMINHEIKESTRLNRGLNPKLELMLQSLDTSEDEKNMFAPLHWFSTAITCGYDGKVDEAMQFYKKGVEALKTFARSENRSSSLDDIQRMYNINSWNLSCTLLRAGDFKNGWRLYDHGLRTPAESAQRWQRSLFKPASSETIKLWKGENLNNKNILLLGEQGIGDSMQFLTCIDSIIERAKKVTIILPDRIQPIYKRSLEKCNVYGQKQIQSGEVNFNSDDYDYQSPLGSILQYEFTKASDITNNNVLLKTRKDIVENLRKKYSVGKPLVGISWQGGGTGSRLKEKTIPLENLCNELKEFNCRFVSLQYGDDEKVVNRIANKVGIDLIDDPDIQAMKDMELWLDQVQCCKLVISVANTTIHGSGGLGIPTFCLLGRKADWRWLHNPKTSYWYPSVIVSQYNDNDEWETSLKEAKAWLRSQLKAC